MRFGPRNRATMVVTVLCGVAAVVGGSPAATLARAAIAVGAAVTPGVETIGVGSDPDGVAVDAATGSVYVANEGDDSVSVIDGATGTVTATVSVGSKPRGIAVDAMTDTLYVANSGDGTVSVIDGKTDKVTATPTVGAGVDAIAVNETTDTIFVSWHDGIATIEGATDAVTPLAIDTVLGTGINDDMAVDPARNELYLVNYASANVLVIDTATNQWVSYYQVGMTPDAVAVDQVHQLLYVGNCQATYFSGLWIIDLSTGDTTAQLDTGCPAAVAADPANSTGYSVDANNNVTPGTLSLVSGSPATITARIAAGEAPDAMAVDPATGTVYVANDTLSGTVTAITPAAPAFTNARHATFRVGKPGTFAVTASGFPKATFAERGRLPKGVTFSATGTLHGTPATGTGGAYPLTVTAANGISPAATETFMLTVDQLPAITSPHSAVFRHGRKNTFTVKSTGYPAAIITEKGKLPPGVTFRATRAGTATLSGAPAKSAAGHTYVLTFRAVNAVGRSPARTFTLRVT
jgi:YVTN family beta-propeller protein